MEINSRKDFLAKLGQFYRVMDFPDRQLKLEMLSENMGSYDYYYYRLFKEITDQQWYNGFPDWSQSKSAFRDNFRIDDPALIEYDDKQIKKGRWVCKGCKGLKLLWWEEKRGNHTYPVAKNCSMCGGKGKSTVNEQNVFKEYIGKKANEDFVLQLSEKLKTTELK